MKAPNVALVGRPNVGKSTLFNRIIQRREAIVDPTPGVTRDIKHAETDWAGYHFILTDTGGYISKSNQAIDTAVRILLIDAIVEADVVIFMVDGKAGITGQDEDIAELLRPYRSKTILVVNKIDDTVHEASTAEFYDLGLGSPISLSALNGRKIGDFLDVVVSLLPQKITLSYDENDQKIRLAVVGRPNVGKSSYINAVLGTSKLLVTDVPGTTRDAIDTQFTYKGREFILVDTAGLRRKTKVSESVEYYSTQRALRAIRNAHAVVLMIDAVDGLVDQDKKILEQIIRHKKSILLVINKWDLIEKTSKSAQEFEKRLHDQLRTVDYLPMLFISAITKQRIFKVLDITISIYEERNKIIRTRELNAFLDSAIKRHTPPAYGGKQVKIKYCSQVKSAPPVFAFFCNNPRGIGAHYRQYLENQLRQNFGFFGVPLTLSFRKK